ncbi:MAG: hypothetical protein J3K34DRAFT_461255 [Monoraphidium minutum]|nr:MAG: hypothetical protein J3K34DRAFT_461255 [Monoraphidium minutum]
MTARVVLLVTLALFAGEAVEARQLREKSIAMMAFDALMNGNGAQTGARRLSQVGTAANWKGSWDKSYGYYGNNGAASAFDGEVTPAEAALRTKRAASEGNPNKVDKDGKAVAPGAGVADAGPSEVYYGTPQLSDVGYLTRRGEALDRRFGSLNPYDMYMN